MSVRTHPGPHTRRGEAGAGTSGRPRTRRRPARVRRSEGVLCRLCDAPVLPPDEPYASPFGPICALCLEDIVPDPESESPADCAPEPGIPEEVA